MICEWKQEEELLYLKKSKCSLHISLPSSKGVELDKDYINKGIYVSARLIIF